MFLVFVLQNPVLRRISPLMPVYSISRRVKVVSLVDLAARRACPKQPFGLESDAARGPARGPAQKLTEDDSTKPLKTTLG